MCGERELWSCRVLCLGRETGVGVVDNVFEETSLMLYVTLCWESGLFL